MATNAATLNTNILRRPSERSFYLAAAIIFPLLVLAGYFRSYYFRSFFTDVPLASWLVHAHGIVMSAWVVYFSSQIALIRTRNYKLHMSMGFVGIGLAAVMVIVRMSAAYSAHVVRHTAPAGIDPYSFFLIPTMDMLFFVLFLGGSIYFRKGPAEHKSLMLMTAINFMPPALARISPVPAEYMMLWSFGVPAATAVGCLLWNWRKHGKLNRVFAGAVVLFIASYPLRIFIAGTEFWHHFVASIAP